MHDAPASAPRTFAEGWAAYLVAAGGLSLVDSALVLVRSGEPLGALHHAALGVALAAWVALPAAVGVLILSLVARAGANRWVVGLLGSGLAAGVATLVLAPWNVVVDPYHLGALVPAVCMLAGLAATALWRRAWLTRLLLLGALLAFASDAFVLRGLYPKLHQLAGFFALQLAMLAVWRLGVRLRPVVVVAAVAHLALLPDARGERMLARRHGTLQDRWLGVIHLLVDRDRDGVSPVFWGGDCDDGNPEIRPGRCEIPGNRVDENCNGLDGTTWPPPTVAPGVARRPDVYIVLVDALRADRAGAGPMVHVDRLAATSLAFTRAYTPYPSTYRAISSITQSRSWRYATGGAPHLLDRFVAAGYDTQLWIRGDRLVHSRERPALSARQAQADPFEIKDAKRKLGWTAKLVDDALAERQTPSPRPRFRWLHVLDTHAPTLRGQGSARERYQAELGHVDAELGRLLAGLPADAVVIFLADHGEAFGEHGGGFHGADLFEETVAVPLVMHLPGVAARRIATPMSTMDLVPTLAHYLGWAADPGWMGHDWLASDSPPVRVLSQTDPVDNWGGAGLPAMQMVADGPWKLIVDVDHDLVSLYDLEHDPGERKDLVGERPEVVERLRGVWAAWMDLPGCRE